MSLKRIVCPVNFTEASYIALVWANAFAAMFHATLYVVHVVPQLPIEDPRTHQALVDRYTGLLRRAVDEFGADDVRVIPTLTSGDITDEIVRMAGNIDADLLIMASCDRTTWAKYRDGSVAEEVASRVDCPVVTLSVSDGCREDREPLTQIPILLN